MRVFNIDITRKGISPVVQVTEYDAMSRFFTLVLRNGSSDYEPPENPTYSVWYKTKDSHGWYDTITEPDEGTHPAVVADGNAFTIEIAEQATTSCGELALMINGDDGYQLTVSGIITRSDDIPGYDGEEVENYYNVYITEMRENAARAENAADIAVAYGATVEVDEEAQQLNITHHSDTEGGVGWLFGSAVTSEAEGSVAAFTDGANDVAVKSLVAEITPVQSGSGDPSPDNIRPISGRTGLTVTASGRNLLPQNTTLTPTTSNGITFTYNADGSITANGTATGAAMSRGVYFRLPFGNYWKSERTYVQYKGTSWRTVTGGGSTSNFMTIDEDMELVCRINISSGTTLDNVTYYPYIYAESDTSTEYEPYVGASYPITWETEAGTVYGGTLDVVSGVLTVDSYYYEVPAESVMQASSGGYQYFATPNRPIGAAYTEAPVGLYCNRLPSVPRSATRTNAWGIAYDTGVDRLQMKLQDITTQEDARAWVTNNPLQVVYKLATPQTYQLTPTEVRTILGGNTIYTDAGEVSVEYVADTKLYIDNKVAELQALILEN